MSSSIDPRIKILPSTCLVTYVNDMSDDIEKPESLKNNLTCQTELVLEDIEWIFKKQKKDKNVMGKHFHELLEECQTILPEPKISERNPELEARVQKLKHQQEKLEYQQMTKNIDRLGPFSSNTVSESISSQVQEINSYLIVILQFVVSVLTSFAAGYNIPYYLYGMQDVALRLVIGLCLAFVVAVADLYFVMRMFMEKDGVIDMAKAKKYQ